MLEAGDSSAGSQSRSCYVLEAVTLFRGGREPLLCLDNLVITRGTFTCFTGASGAGKSSLLSALAGLNSRVTGKILQNGRDLQQLSDRQLANYRRQHLGLVFQHFHLFDELSALDNAVSQANWSRRSKRVEIDLKARELLVQLGIQNSGIQCAMLSGGERQRVAVARALAAGASILLADEPTASLDTQSGRTLIKVLLDHTVAQGKTLIACSHDDALIDAADTVYHINDTTLTRTKSPLRPVYQDECDC